MAYTVNTSAAALNRAFNNANATPTAFAATAAALTADQIAAANTFDDGTLSDLALSTKVLTNMGILPSTVAEVVALEAALADYFAGPGKGNRGFVVLQLAEILSGFAATDVFYGAAAAAWNAEVAASVADATSTTVALTTAATDNVVGSSADDIFSAISSALATVGTLNTGDKISGGAGNDTLNVAVSTTWSGLPATAFTSIETVNLTNSNGNNLSFDMTGINGVTAISVTAAAGELDLVDVASGLTTLTLNGFANTLGTEDFDLAYAADASETSALTNALAVNLNTVGLPDTATAYRNAVLTLDDIETVNVSATGVNNVSLDSTDMTKLTLAGSGDFTLASTGANLATVDSSAFTGTSYLYLNDIGSSTLKSVAAGSGDDTISVDMADLKANATISGGAGANSLAFEHSGSSAAAAEYTMTGIQTLSIGATGAGVTLSGAKTTGLTAVKLASTTDEIISLVNMGASNLTFTQTGTGASVTHNSDHTGSTTLNFVKASTATAASPSAPMSDFTFSKATGALNVSVGAAVNGDTTTITAPYASAVNLTVASSLTAAGAESTAFDSTIEAARATSISVTVDGKLTTGAEIKAVKATSATITYNGTTAASSQGVLELETPLLTSLTLSTATAFDTTNSTAPSDFSKVQTLVVDAKSGTTTFGDLLDASSVTLSGAGTTSKVVLGTVGATDNAYDVNLTATGLRSSSTYAADGLTVTDINVGAGYDVNVNVAGMTGNATIANGQTIGDSDTDDVTVTATNIGGTLTLGNITASGDVTVLASGARGASVGNLTGDKITVDVSNTSNVSTVGTTIAAKSSVDLTLHALAGSANYDVTAAANSTGLSVKVVGGLNDDDVIVNSNLTVKTIALSGNLGADTSSGNDDVTINANYAVAKTIDLSGLSNYETSTISGGSKIDTIVGGAGVDTIYAGAEADVLTGGAGADVFWFNAGESTYDKPDTITDLSSTDIIKFAFTNSDAEKATAVSGGSDTANIDAFGVATFASMTSSSTLALKVQGINKAVTTTGHTALFTHDGSTYLFAEINGNATADTTALVVKLTGVSLPTLAANIFDDDASGTGLSGFGQ